MTGREGSAPLLCGSAARVGFSENIARKKTHRETVQKPLSPFSGEGGTHSLLLSFPALVLVFSLFNESLYSHGKRKKCLS
jgi:hypothetical protein